MIRLGAGDVAQLLEHLPNMYKLLVQSLAPYESGMCSLQAFNSSTEDVEAGIQ